MENINLIRRIAWSFHYTTGFDYEELFSEASLGYCEAMRTYNPKKNCKFTTYAWEVMRNQLITFLKQEKRVNSIPLTEDVVKMNCTYAKVDDFRLIPESLIQYPSRSYDDFLEDVPNSQEFVKFVVEVCWKIVPDDMTSELAKGFIIKALRIEGWSWPKIWSNFRKIKKSLKES